jgi:hypothetical protein
MSKRRGGWGKSNLDKVGTVQIIIISKDVCFVMWLYEYYCYVIFIIMLCVLC